MSDILELLGRGLASDLGDVLGRHFRSPSGGDAEQLRELCEEQAGSQDGPSDAPGPLGLRHLSAGQFEEAVRHLDKACRMAPDCFPARLALASAHDEGGDVASALKHLRIAERVRPGRPAVLFAMGLCCEKQGQTDAAAGHYREAIAQAGSFLPARERLAAVAVAGGDLNDAVEQYRILREAEPREIFYQSALGHLCYRAGRHAEAVEEFQTAIGMEPENWAFADDEVEELIGEGAIDEAMSRLHALIDEQGPFADLLVRLADLYALRGDDDSAVRNYLTALDAQPGYIEATVKLGTHHFRRRRWEEAAEAFHRAAELNDRVLSWYVGMGVAQAADGRKADARWSFELAAAVEPNSTLLLAETAKLQLQNALTGQLAGEGAGGAEALAEAGRPGDELLERQIERHGAEVALHPRQAELRYRYGVLLRAGGRAMDALGQFRRAGRVSPAYDRALIKLGISQQELGLPDEAAETFRQAFDVSAESVKLHYRLGLLYTRRDRFEQVVREMEAVGRGGAEDIRADLALSLQEMNLMDRLAATWRSLRRMHRARAG